MRELCPVARARVRDRRCRCCELGLSVMLADVGAVVAAEVWVVPPVVFAERRVVVVEEVPG